LYDKRFIYEESLRMPFIVRYPKEVEAGSVSKEMVLNTDFAPLFLDLAETEIPESFQGRSLRPLLQGKSPEDWRQSMYYRYWMHKDGVHNVYAHYGLRTHRYKLIYYYSDALGQPGTREESHPPEWELFDLAEDPCELNNVYHEPAYAEIIPQLKDELHRRQAEVKDKGVEEVG